MAEKIICDANDLTAIADAVRASTGGTETFTVPELSVAAVSAIGSGGSTGGGVETCTVEISSSQDSYNASMIAYTTVSDDGEISAAVANYPTTTNSATIKNVVCGSMLFVEFATQKILQLNNIEVLDNDNGGSNVIFKVTAAAGETALIYNYSTGGGGEK